MNRISKAKCQLYRFFNNGSLEFPRYPLICIRIKRKSVFDKTIICEEQIYPEVIK